jgi:dihydrofolate reductase
MNLNQNIKISLISAIDRESRTIGKEGGGLPWRIPEDFKYFKEKTIGHPIIMGRTTWEEFGGKPLPGRHHIVITRQTDYKIADETSDRVSVAETIEKALELASEIENNSHKENKFSGENKEKEIFVIGGAQIYELALSYANRLYLTLVDAHLDGPVKFPDYKTVGFTKIISSRQSSDENFSYEFVVLEK